MLTPSKRKRNPRRSSTGVPMDDEDAATSLTPGFQRLNTAATPASSVSSGGGGGVGGRRGGAAASAAAASAAANNNKGQGGHRSANAMVLETPPPSSSAASSVDGVGRVRPEALALKLRRLAGEALEKRLHARAAFYADKLVTLGQQHQHQQLLLPLSPQQRAEDVLLLAKAYHQGRDYRRAVHTLERHGLLAVKDSPEPLTLQQQLLLYTPTRGSAGGCSWGLEACFLAAQCLEASDRYEECLQLLEQVMPWDDAEAEEAGDHDEGFTLPPSQPPSNLQEIRAAILLATEEAGVGAQQQPKAQQAPAKAAAAAGTRARKKGGAAASEAGAGGVQQQHASSGMGGEEAARSVLSTLAAMCCLRAQIYESQDNRGRAVAWCKNALRLDVYCVEALEFLVDRKLLSQAEEAHLLSHELSFPGPALDDGGNGEEDGEGGDWLRMLYTTRLLCFQDSSLEPHQQHRALLHNFASLEGAGLGGSAVVLTSKAEMAYSYQQNAQLAYRLAKQVYAADPLDESCLPIYICAMAELGLKTELYYCAHQLVEAHPKSAVSWFAVGCYYAAVRKNEAAQRYFHKATKMDHRFAPAWIGFGNAFAAQDESDQAMSAYRTASRLFPASHVPLLYMGMEYLRTNNLALAAHFLQAAKDLNAADPLVHNEMGVVCFLQGRYEEAAECFQHVLDLCQAFATQAMEKWETTIVNLGHCHRKLGNLHQAVKLYERAVGLCPRRASSYASLAFTHQLLGQLDQAIEYYHRALGLRPDDAFAASMLSRALSEVLTLQAQAAEAQERGLGDGCRALSSSAAEWASVLKTPGGLGGGVGATPPMMGGGRGMRGRSSVGGLSSVAGDLSFQPIADDSYDLDDDLDDDMAG